MTVQVSKQWNVLDLSLGEDLRGTSIPPLNGFFTSAAEATAGAASGIIGVLTAATKNFNSSANNFVPAHVGTYVNILVAVNPTNLGMHAITQVIDSNNVILGDMVAPVDEAGLTWKHHGGGDGADFMATPAGGWGFQYGRVPTEDQFYIAPAAWPGQYVEILPGSKGIRDTTGLPYTVLDDLEGRPWEFLVEVSPVAPTGQFTYYCGRPSDGIGGAVRVAVSFTTSWFLTTEIWDDTTFSWVALAPVPYDTSDTFRVRMIYNNTRNTIQVFVYGVYLGEYLAGSYAAGVGSANPVGIFGTWGFFSWNHLSWQIGTHPHYGDLKPKAHAGMDRVSPIGRWVGFDAKNSVDQDETHDLSYFWKLVLAPSGSAFVYQASDGNVLTASTLQSVLSAFTPANGFAVGDVLIVQGVPYEVTAFPAVDTLQVMGILPSGYAGQFQVVKQTDTKGGTSRVFSFEPDVKGLYAAFLEVMDSDGYFSEPDFAVCNVIDDNVPLTVPLDMSWLWSYLGDFWKLVDRKDWIHEAWMAIARLAGTTLHDAWNVDFDKSLATTQNVISRRWLLENPAYYEQDPDATTFTDRRCPALSLFNADYTTMTTGVIPPGPSLVVTVRMFVEDTTLSLDFTLPAGTALLDIPGLVEADLATAGAIEPRWLLVHCGWRLINLPNTDTSLPPHSGEWYRLAFTADSYVIDVTDSLGLFMPSTPNFFVGPSTHLAERTSARMVRLWFADVDRAIQAGDILNLAGRSFNIVGVNRAYSTVAPYAALDVEVSPDIPEVPFGSALFWCIPSYWTSVRTPWYDAGVTPGDMLFVETRPAGETDTNPGVINLEVAGAGVRKIGTVDYRAFFPSVDYKLNRARRHFYLAVPTNLLEMPRLQQDVDTPTWIMEEFKDHFVDNRRNGRFVVLDFRHEPYGEMEAYSFYRDRSFVSFLEDWLWAEVAYYDNRPTVENNFGRMVNFFVQDFANSPDANYLSVVTDLWKAYSTGPTPANMDTAAAIIGGFPYAESAGTIVQIVEDFVPGYSYAFIRDDDQTAVVRSYVFYTGKGIAINPDTGVAYANGDHIERFTLLVQGQTVFNYLDDPDWWMAVRSSGIVSEVEKVHRFGLMLDINYFDQSLFDKILGFILDFKKTHTYPIVMGYDSETDDIEIEDECTQTVYLYLPTALWSYPVPPDLDVPRLGAGTKFEPMSPSADDTEILVRIKDPILAAGDDYRVRLIPAGAPGHVIKPGPSPDFVYSIDGHFVPGVTMAADMVAILNTSPGSGDYIEAYLPPGAVGGTLLRVDARTPGTPGITFRIVVGSVLGVVDVVGPPSPVTLTVVDGVTSLDDIVNEINTNSTLLTATLLDNSNPTVPLPWLGRLNVGNLFGVEALNGGVYTFEIQLGGALNLDETAPPACVLTVVLGVTTIRDVLDLINSTSVLFSATEVTSGFVVPTFAIDPGIVPVWAPLGPLPAEQIWGPTDVMSGSGTLDRDIGWHDVNPRGKHQLRLDAGGAWLPAEGPAHNYPGVLDYTAQHVDFAGPGTLLSANVGANVINAVATSGDWARITILDGAWPSYRFHDDGAASVATEFRCRKHWMVFFDAANVFNCMAPIVGVESGIAPTGFGPGAGGPSTYVDVLLPAGVIVPLPGDSFVIFDGMPDRTAISFPIATADTYLSADFKINEVLAINPVAAPAPPQYQIQVNVPYFFSTVGGPHLLLPDQDYLLFFDSNGSLATMGKLITVDNGAQGDLVTVELVPSAVATSPQAGYFFVILRNPSFTWSGDPDEFENFHLGMRSMGFERGPFKGTITLT